MRVSSLFTFYLLKIEGYGNGSSILFLSVYEDSVSVVVCGRYRDRDCQSCSPSPPPAGRQEQVVVVNSRYNRIQNATCLWAGVAVSGRRNIVGRQRVELLSRTPQRVACHTSTSLRVWRFSAFCIFVERLQPPPLLHQSLWIYVRYIPTGHLNSWLPLQF